MKRILVLPLIHNLFLVETVKSLAVVHINLALKEKFSSDMGSKKSNLIPFLEKALQTGKYGSDLFYVDKLSKVFKMNLPHKTQISKHQDIIQFLKDWDVLKNHKEAAFDYTISHARMRAALKRSVYLEKCMDDQPKQLTYRILLQDEVKSKKVKNSKCIKYTDPSSVESGYHSSGSPVPDLPPEGSSSIAFQPDAGSTSSNVIEGGSGNLNQDHNIAPFPSGTPNLADVEMEETNHSSMSQYVNVPDHPPEGSSSVAFQPAADSGSLNVIEGDSNNLNQDPDIAPFSSGTPNLTDVEIDENNHSSIPQYVNEFERGLSELFSSSGILLTGAGSSSAIEGNSNNLNQDHNIGSSRSSLANLGNSTDVEMNENSQSHFDLATDYNNYSPGSDTFPNGNAESLDNTAESNFMETNLSHSDMAANNNNVNHNPGSGTFPNGHAESLDNADEINWDEILSNLPDLATNNNVNHGPGSSTFPNGNDERFGNSDELNSVETNLNNPYLATNNYNVNHGPGSSTFPNGNAKSFGNSAELNSIETNLNNPYPIYRLKEEIPLNEETLIICKEMNISDGEEISVKGWRGHVVHSDLFRRIENLELKKKDRRDNHLFLYFSLQRNISRA